MRPDLGEQLRDHGLHPGVAGIADVAERGRQVRGTDEHADGTATIEEVGWELVRLTLDVSIGRKKTWAEQWKLHNVPVLFNPAPGDLKKRTSIREGREGRAKDAIGDSEICESNVEASSAQWITPSS